MQHFQVLWSRPSGSHPQHGNEEELLTLGLHLFQVIARLGPQRLSEIDRSLYVRLFSRPIVSVLRFTSVSITEMLGKHLPSGISLHLQTEFPSAVPLAVENHMLTLGLSLLRILFAVDPEADGGNPAAVHISEHIKDDAKSIAETVDYVTAQMAWLGERRRRHDHITRWVGKMDMHRDDRISWAVVANNFLMDQICKSEVFPGTITVAERMRSLHKFYYGCDPEQEEAAITEDNKIGEAMRFMGVIDRLAEVDWYEVVEKKISLLIPTAPREGGADGLMNAIVSHFRGAFRLVPGLREAILDDLQDGDVWLPHFGYLSTKKYVKKASYLMGEDDAGNA